MRNADSSLLTLRSAGTAGGVTVSSIAACGAAPRAVTAARTKDPNFMATSFVTRAGDSARAGNVPVLGYRKARQEPDTAAHSDRAGPGATTMVRADVGFRPRFAISNVGNDEELRPARIDLRVRVARRRRRADGQLPHLVAQEAADPFDLAVGERLVDRHLHGSRGVIRAGRGAAGPAEELQARADVHVHRRDVDAAADAPLDDRRALGNVGTVLVVHVRAVGRGPRDGDLGHISQDLVQSSRVSP